METKLFAHFNSKDPNSNLDLTDSEIQQEFRNLMQNQCDYLFSLYALEKIPHKFNYEEVALSQLRFTAKYTIYNLRILKLLKCDIRYTTYLFKILKLLKAESKDKCKIDMNRLKVGSDTAKTVKYVNYVTRKCLKLLMKYLQNVSNSVGFPEIAFWVVKELKSIEGTDECISLIEKQRKYVEEKRKGVSVFDKQAITKLEMEIEKINN